MLPGRGWDQAGCGGKYRPKTGRCRPEHRQGAWMRRIAELKSAKSVLGGLRECVIRGLLYVGAWRRGMSVDGMCERSLGGVAASSCGRTAGLAPYALGSFKTIVREQFFMLLLEPEAKPRRHSKAAASWRRPNGAPVLDAHPQCAVRECGNLRRSRQGRR